jgi:hypothetical protein
MMPRDPAMIRRLRSIVVRSLIETRRLGAFIE